MSELAPIETRHSTEATFQATYPAPDFELEVNKGRSAAKGLFLTVTRRVINGVEQPMRVYLDVDRTKKDGTTNRRAVKRVLLTGNFTWELRQEFEPETQAKLREYAAAVQAHFLSLWEAYS